MNSDTLLIRYALVFCFARTFAHRNFCAIAIFRRAAADIMCFLACPFGAASVPANSRITSIALSIFQAADSAARSQTASNVTLPLALATWT
jgi:hypothetical protein